MNIKVGDLFECKREGLFPLAYDYRLANVNVGDLWIYLYTINSYFIFYDFTQNKYFSWHQGVVDTLMEKNFTKFYDQT